MEGPCGGSLRRVPIEAPCGVPMDSPCGSSLCGSLRTISMESPCGGSLWGPYGGSLMGVPWGSLVVHCRPLAEAPEFDYVHRMVKFKAVQNTEYFIHPILGKYRTSCKSKKK